MSIRDLIERGVHLLTLRELKKAAKSKNNIDITEEILNGEDFNNLTRHNKEDIVLDAPLLDPSTLGVLLALENTPHIEEYEKIANRKKQKKLYIDFSRRLEFFPTSEDNFEVMKNYEAAYTIFFKFNPFLKRSQVKVNPTELFKRLYRLREYTFAQFEPYIKVITNDDYNRKDTVGYYNLAKYAIKLNENMDVMIYDNWSKKLYEKTFRGRNGQYNLFLYSKLFYDMQLKTEYYEYVKLQGEEFIQDFYDTMQKYGGYGGYISLWAYEKDNNVSDLTYYDENDFSDKYIKFMLFVKRDDAYIAEKMKEYEISDFQIF